MSSPAWEDSHSPDTARLIRRGLDAYTFVTLPPDDPRRLQYRPAYLESLARHHAIRHRLAPLLRAWSEAGIEALLFKGFHLSEFVYPVPGARLHGDVDVLVARRDAPRAREIALSLGWLEAMSLGRHRKGRSHNPFNLIATDAPIYLDVHDRVIHVYRRRDGVQRRITEAVWSGSGQRSWEGTTIRLPSSADAFLILALNRVWVDGGKLKSHDVFDAKLLAASMKRSQVLERARELGCDKSLEIFLRMCDPWSTDGDVPPSLPSKPPSAARRLADSARMFPERGWVDGEVGVLRYGLIPKRLWWAVRSLPAVVRVRFLLRREGDLRRILERLTPHQTGFRDHGSAVTEYFWIVGGVRWAQRIFRGRHPETCVSRSLTIYHRLRKRRIPAVFVTGVRRDEDGSVVGHAWVELDGAVLPELHEPTNRRVYSISIEYPPAREPEMESSPARG